MKFRLTPVALCAFVAAVIGFYIQWGINSGIGWDKNNSPPAWFIAAVVAVITAAALMALWWLCLFVSSRSKLTLAIIICLLILASGCFLWSLAFYRLGYYPLPRDAVWHRLEGQCFSVGAGLVKTGVVLFILTFAYFLFGYDRPERRP